MNAEEIALARRVVACGLPVPKWPYYVRHDQVHGFATSETMFVPGGSVARDPDTGLTYRPVWTGEKLELLPVLDDFALLGWIITEARHRLNESHLRARWSKSSQRWEVYGDSHKWQHIAGHHVGTGDTEVEALVAALEAAKAAK